MKILPTLLLLLSISCNCFAENKKYILIDSNHYKKNTNGSILVEEVSPSETSNLEKLAYALIGIAVSSVLQVAIIQINKWITKRNEFRLILAELEDMKRHFNANAKILNLIDLNNLATEHPASMHFEKMKILDESILLSQEAFRSISPRKARALYNVKLVIRNFNIEIDETKKYGELANYDPEKLKLYIDYLKYKNTLIAERRIPEIYDFLTKKTEFNNTATPKELVYILREQ